jgi:hypothetical protein
LSPFFITGLPFIIVPLTLLSIAAWLSAVADVIFAPSGAWTPPNKEALVPSFLSPSHLTSALDFAKWQRPLLILTRGSLSIGLIGMFVCLTLFDPAEPPEFREKVVPIITSQAAWLEKTGQTGEAQKLRQLVNQVREEGSRAW